MVEIKVSRTYYTWPVQAVDIGTLSGCVWGLLWVFGMDTIVVLHVLPRLDHTVGSQVISPVSLKLHIPVDRPGASPQDGINIHEQRFWGFYTKNPLFLTIWPSLTDSRVI